MKVLQLGKFYPVFGGVEKVMRDLAIGLGCDMLCASADKKRKFNTISHDGGGCIFVAPTLFKAAGTMIAPQMVSWLNRHAREYDLIDIHHPDPMAGLALRLSRFKGKVILHWHSDIIGKGVFRFLYKPIQHWLVRRADKIVGTTPVYVSESPDLKDVQDKTTFIPIGIEPLIPEEESVDKIRRDFEGKKLVFSLGRLIPYKGYEHLIRAACYLPEDYKVVIAGSGPLRDSLQKEIDQLELHGKVTLAGYLEDKDLPAWFAAADVFVLPSVTKNEAFGIVQIEAMSFGTPVVATRIPGSGVSWVNKEGVSGLNVEPRDPEDLARAILEITKDEIAHRSFGDGAKSRFEEMFRKELMIKELEKLYEKRI
ncbi:MAG: glycosyltransferase [Bacteroidales bacterium]|nr:glycosyltransferase [Bacteroidales bacterium]